ncbi:MAG: tyrosine-type recombinase/integrase [Verrucomicrobiales bacterium]
MASIRRKPASKYWHACFYDAQGRRCQRSTGEVNRKAALKIANAFEEAARRQHTATQIRRVMNDIVADVLGESLADTTTRQFFDGWIARKKGEVSASTWAFYKRAVTFIEFLGDDADKPLDAITEKRVLAFRDHLAKEVAPKTVNHRVKLLRMIFAEAKRDKLIADNPAEGVRTLRIGDDRNARRPFTIDELKTVLRSIEGTEWHSMVVIGLYTGQRLGDIATIRWRQINFDSGEIAFTTRKTGRRVLVPMCKPLKDHLLSLPSSDDPDAPVHVYAAQSVENASGRSGTLSREFGQILVEAGIREAYKPMEGKTDKRRVQHGLTFHSLRHTAVSMMKNAGISPAIVQDLVGHESAEISAHYTHVESEAKRTAVDSLPDVLK